MRHRRKLKQLFKKLKIEKKQKKEKVQNKCKK